MAERKFTPLDEVAIEQLSEAVNQAFAVACLLNVDKLGEEVQRNAAGAMMEVLSKAQSILAGGAHHGDIKA